jgi:uncharacterized protein YggT (Ycf19 family)
METDAGPVIVEPRARVLRRVAVVDRVARVLDFAFGLLYSLLLIRLVLDFFGARQGAGFVQFIHQLTEVFYAPFRGIFSTEYAFGGHIVWPLVVAIVAYMLLHAVIRALLRVVLRG